MKLPGRGINREDELKEFADALIQINENTGFKVSSRGWCYQLEGLGLITKQEFNRINGLINECRKIGMLPIDFVAEEEARNFYSVWRPDLTSPEDDIATWIKATLNAGDNFKPDYWDGEEYYIQMLVEKVDLVTLFKPVCQKFHIPIATSKGWSSILQRAEIAKRFIEMEETGHTSVLLYCGDYDVAGLEISDTLKKNFDDIKHGTGWDPEDMIVDRFGLNLDFIEQAGLSWIDNLETSGGCIAHNIAGKIMQGKTKAGRPHPDFNKPATQRYLELTGVRKCEANALVTNPKAGRKLCDEAILKYLGEDVYKRMDDLKEATLNDFKYVFETTQILEPLERALALLESKPR